MGWNWIKRVKKKIFNTSTGKGTITVDAVLIADTDEQVLVEVEGCQQWLPKNEIKIFEFNDNQVIIIAPRRLLKTKPPKP